MTFPRAGRICAAQILAELGDVRERFASDDAARRRGRRRSGHLRVGQVQGRHLPLGLQPSPARALTCLADNSRHASAWAAHVYAKAKARGCDHPHAIRILARAWLRVIWRAWIDRKPYDPASAPRRSTAPQPTEG